MRYHTVEHFAVAMKDTWTCTGSIAGDADGKPVTINYKIEADENGNVKSLFVAGPTQKLHFIRKANNTWFSEKGHHLARFDGCTDVDLSMSPSTNTFPIKRVSQGGNTIDINVIYVDVLTMRASPAKQRYVMIDPTHFEYQNISTGFSATLETDNDGWVNSYPGIWSRLDQNFPDERRRFADALISDSFSTEIPEDARFYGRLIGDWEVTAIDYLPDGTKTVTHGQWRFRHVLEGRAIQDVWICPGKRDRNSLAQGTPNRYGSTIRVYDQKSHSWKIHWFNPVTSTENEFPARAEGNDIIQEGLDGAGNAARWRFTAITPTSFEWYGEISKDNGQTWIVLAEFHGHR